MSQAKTTLVRDLSLSESSIASIADGLASRGSAGIALDEPTREARRIVAVSAVKVRAAFAKWIDPARFVEIVEGPPPAR